MKGRYAATAALLLICSPGLPAAESADEAARELARKIAAVTGVRDPVALTFRSIGSHRPSDAVRIRRLVEKSLRDAGVRIDPAGSEARVTLSENATNLLLVAEARIGNEPRHWIVSWPRGAPADGERAPDIALEHRLVWEQEEPILDAAFAPDAVLVLSPSRVARYRRTDGDWRLDRMHVITPARAWPRDLRGRMLVSGSTIRVFLPGMLCSGAWEPDLSLECKGGDEPWAIVSGSRHMLLAAYAPARNYFDGRVTTQAGSRKTVPPFFTAAAVEEAGGVLWLFAGLDGRTLLMDRAFSRTAELPGWGSDIAGADASCGPAAPVLATRPGDENEAIQAFAIVNRQAEPISAPLALAGPVTALWPAAGGALAVVRDESTERYAAYLVTITCPQ